MTTRLLIIEDDPAVRTHFCAAVEQLGYVVVAVCEDAEQALAWAAGGGEAELALIDLGLPGMDGISLIRKLRRRLPQMGLLVLTIFDDTSTIVRALRAGARGYLLKDTPDDELAAALEALAQGRTAVGAQMGARLVEHLNAEGLDEASSSVAEELLTPRERDVLALLCRGLTYADVARVLGIGVGTVQSYVKVIYAKLGVTSKTEAAAVALARKLVDRWTE